MRWALGTLTGMALLAAGALLPGRAGMTALFVLLGVIPGLGLTLLLRPATRLFSYVLRNGLTPFITTLGLNIGWLIGGTIIIEQVFGVPGVGSLLITSILTRDYSIIQFVALVLAVLVISVNLLTDLTYALLDPRVSFRA